MTVHSFGEWMPDQPDYGNKGLLRAENVFPSAQGYLPVPQFSTSTDALDDYPRGARQARNTSGAVFQYAGDEAKLYENVSGEWTDRSKDGGYSSGDEERWEFVAWKNKMLATNFSDEIQQITFGGGQFSDLTEDFRARHIAAVRNFVVAANTFDDVDGNVPSRARWSAFNDETDWAVSAATLSDFQDLKTAAVERLFGGEYGVIFQRESVWRMTFAGAPVVFQFDEVLPSIGLIAPGAAARAGGTIYFLSDKGLFSLDQGAQASPIGAEKVDRFVLDDIDKSHLNRISATADPQSNRVFWSYPGAGNVEGTPNRIIVYDPVVQRWTLIDDIAELLWNAGGTATTLDSLTGVLVDELDVEVDASRWVGGAPEIGMFNADFQSGFMDGAPRMATLETGEFELAEGRRARLSGFRGLVDGGDVSAQIGTRNSQGDAATFGSLITPNSENRFLCRSQARYHRFLFEISGAWERALGIQIERRDLKQGGRRG